MSDFTVVIVGFITVFIGMTTIVLVVYLLSFVLGLFSKNKQKKQKNLVKAQDEIAENESLQSESCAIEEAAENDELIAAIIAAIEMYRRNEAIGKGLNPEKYGSDFKVVAFKKLKTK